MTDMNTIRAPRVRAVEGPCRVFLVRHGTTRMNVENRYRGRADVPLDAQGYQEAVDAARTLSSAGLTAIYTGPLRRTGPCRSRSGRRTRACARRRRPPGTPARPGAHRRDLDSGSRHSCAWSRGARGRRDTVLPRL